MVDYLNQNYVFKMVDSDQRVAFMSKALSATEKRWPTIEQECYAIYLCFRKDKYLLRDIKFMLKTNHRNLFYLNALPSVKVLREELAIQEYDFDVLQIAEIKNLSLTLSQDS